MRALSKRSAAVWIAGGILTLLLALALLAGAVSHFAARFSYWEMHPEAALMPPGTLSVPDENRSFDNDRTGFSLLDSDGSGRIECVKRLNGTSLAGGTAINNADVKQPGYELVVCQELDAAAQAWQTVQDAWLDHRSGPTARRTGLSCQEWEEITSGLNLPAPLRSLFSSVRTDLNRDGIVAYNEVVKAGAVLQFTSADLNAWDRNGDGNLTREEFPGAPVPVRHLLGTDLLGRDLFVRLGYGLRISLLVALCAASVAFLLGSLYGLGAGLARGIRATLSLRLLEVLQSTPFVFVVILVSVFVRDILRVRWADPHTQALAQAAVLFAVLGAVQWFSLARYARGLAASLREAPFMRALRGMGVSSLRLIIHHLLPNLILPLLAHALLLVPALVLEEAFLSFLGFGVQPPFPSLGNLLQDGVNALDIAPLLVAAPATVILLLAWSLHVLADAAANAVKRGQEFQSAAGLPNLHSVQAEVERYSRVFIIGRSGAGKSTLLRRLLYSRWSKVDETPPEPGVKGDTRGLSPPMVGCEGVEDCHSGRLSATFPCFRTFSRVDTLLAVQDPGLAFSPYRRIGAQLADAFPNRACAGQTLEHPLRALGLDTSRVLAAHPHELSGGMLKRVLLAGVLARTPSRALFDEPTSGLDPSTRWLAAETIVKNAPSFVVATHDLDLPRACADAAIINLDKSPLPHQRGMTTPRQTFSAGTGRESRFESGRVLLSVSHVSVHYRGSTTGALNDFSAAVKSGGRLVVVGESGAGKSTLLHAIAGFVRPVAGTIKVDEVDVWKSGASRRQARKKLGLVLQTPRESLDPTWKLLDAVEEIALALSCRSGVREETLALLATLGIGPELYNRRPHQLSGGECQRVAVARAVLHRPSLILADEPTASLDAANQEVLSHKLAALVSKNGIGLVYVTHNLRDHLLYGSQVAVLLAGWQVEWIESFHSWDEMLHPYTRYLVRALEGPVPPLYPNPNGCPFFNVCEHPQKECRTKVPDQREASPGHLLRCPVVVGSTWK